MVAIGRRDALGPGNARAEVGVRGYGRNRRWLRDGPQFGEADRLVGLRGGADDHQRRWRGNQLVMGGS
ncbi:hypothetical protein KCP74_03380 [Salmonella enterica subsp. enterica]|nr:hypothetical protein KCP74_03380 [Salmonella enterica subsp. enterica]